MLRTGISSALVALVLAGAVQADTLDISFGQPNYQNMVRDAKLRGDGGLLDWNLGATVNEGNRFYPNFNADGVTLNSNNRKNTFLQWFDVSSILPGSTIHSATLTTVFGNSGNAAANNRTFSGVKLSRMLPGNDWVETLQTPPGTNGPHFDGSVTWSNRVSLNPGAIPWGLPGALLAGTDFDAATTQTFSLVGVQGQSTKVVRDITSWVQYWVDNPSHNTGMLWWGGNNDPGDDRAFKLGTKEDGAGGTALGAAPSLVIEYTPIPEPASVALLAVGVLGLGCRRIKRTCG